jgi:hypothetical protein
MKTSSVPILLSLAIVFLFGGPALSRAQEEPCDLITRELSTTVGPDFKCVDCIEIDRFVGDENYYQEPIDDPYGTLANSFIFVAVRGWSGTSVVGVFKGGHVVWHSDTTFASPLELFTCGDINADGLVELLFQEENPRSHLWIFGWNGSTGRLINAVDEDSLSVIEAPKDCFVLVDTEGDGIWEITDNTVADGSATWSWNGQQYGMWPSTPHLPDSTLWPRNRIGAKVQCSVGPDSLGLAYRYTVLSQPTSKQRVERFSVFSSSGVLEISGPAMWKGGIVPGEKNLSRWSAVGERSSRGLIRPGASQTGFTLKAERKLCKIIVYTLQGRNRLSRIFGLPYKDVIDRSARDERENAVTGLTLGPSLPQEPFDAIKLVDSLLSDVGQARVLGWIITQAAADKYAGYFAGLRDRLRQNNSSQARATLQRILTEVGQDSSICLSSEAYALLRYNGEFLLSRIPEPGLAVKLVNSTGSRITGGTLQYYEGGWKDAVGHNDGTFSINTAQHSMSLRMTYEGGVQTKTNVIVGPDTAMFQTVAATARLVNSQGTPIDTGNVQYYAGAWRVLGMTTSGAALKELLPVSYSFRMTYAYGSIDKQQDLSTNPVVVFQTVSTSVQLQSSQGLMIDQGTVQYYAGAWRVFGTTTGGVAARELLPSTYSFRMTYAYGSIDKQQNVGINPTVMFQTAATTVRLRDSQGNPLTQGAVQYYSGAWRDFGAITNGTVTRELLPKGYSFRMTYAYASLDKAQDVSANPTVDFSTVLCTVRVKNSQGVPVNGAQGSYYSGAWRTLGTTVNGEITKELIPINFTFRATSNGTSQDKAQNLSTNPVVEFTIQP